MGIGVSYTAKLIESVLLSLGNKTAFFGFVEEAFKVKRGSFVEPSCMKRSRDLLFNTGEGKKDCREIETVDVG
jgi:hypothetical protein